MSLAKIGNVHHSAYRCRDAEQTRWFYEDVLGLRLRAALTFDDISGTDIAREYMHLFFEMPDGNFVAFFDDPSSASPDQFDQRDGFDIHIAFEIDNEEDLLNWKRKIRDARIKCAGPIDHHFVKSIYFYDPNGYQVEITCKADDYVAIMDKEEAVSGTEMKEWTARTRERKEKLFGAEKIDQREISEFFHS